MRRDGISIRVHTFLSDNTNINLRARTRSAVLDILDYVRKESLKMLVDHLVEHFGHRFDDVDYVDTLRQLRLKYDQMHEVPDDAAGGGGDGGGGEPSGDGS
eukprot:277850-Chlamydomonas_euryale.AAC.1